MNLEKTIKILRDVNARRLLAWTFFTSRTVNELSARLGISVAQCYGLIRKLEKAGLMERVGSVVSKGHEAGLYRSVLKGGYFSMEKGKVRLKFQLTDSNYDGYERWESLDLLC